MVSAARLYARREVYFEKTAASNFFIRPAYIELHLDDLVGAAIDGGKSFVHLFAEAADLNAHVADLIVHVSADVLAFPFDETGKLLELGLFLLWHGGRYTIRGASTMRWHW
jgi:hypothetical protein